MVAIKNLVSTSLLTSVALAREAPYNSDSKRKAVARAHLDKGLLKGIIEFTSNNGVVDVHLDVTGLPPNAGPFQYHILDSKVSRKGNCEDGGSVLNPYDAHYKHCDDLDNDALCSVGDLSGKHGYINTTCFETRYSDPYLSLNPNNRAFVGSKSLVITDQNNKKISCGNIKMKRRSKFARDEDADYDEDDESFIEPYNNYTNSSNYNYEEETSTYDSGSNTLYVSGLIGVLAGGLSALI
ncbi:hypothetical protein PMKS-001130 [Pichia membranifaciens]|uniref:Uncharacterized protein n=1 Tax=Pichia membranifaciens TaxID=4926 RepID=A0A1Q2YDQ2_9ASCO|nr:hypothetical protein PMKS-001130 [Pichia membranifaciens]